MIERRLIAAAIVGLLFVLAGALSPDCQGLCQPALARKKGKVTEIPSEINYNEGVNRLKAGDWDGAVDSFLQAIYFARNNYYPDAHFNLGIAYKQLGSDAKAIEAFKTSIEQATGPSPDAHLNLAAIYLRNDRLEDCRWAIQEALMEYEYKDRHKAYNMYGLMEEKKGNLAVAADQFLNALGERPWRYTEAWMNLADNYRKQGSWIQALQNYQEMIDKRDDLKGLDFARVYMGLGACRLAKGDYQGAIIAFRTALDANPEYADAHLSLALIFDKEKHISSALKEYKEYMRLRPEAGNIAQIKNRVVALEQKLTPEAARPSGTSPSPYMRRQQEEIVERQRQEREGVDSPHGPGDSGF